MSVAPAFLRLSVLSEEDESTRQRLLGQLSRARKANARQEAYYEGSALVRDLGIAIPPALKDLPAVAGWPEIVVDVIDERMDWRGWLTLAGSDLGLGEVYDQNHLGVEVGQSVLDSLIFGLSYLTVGTGEDDEPDVLVKAESPNRMTATWDSRRRRAKDGLVELVDDRGQVVGWQLYLLGETIRLERQKGRVMVTNRDAHGLDRIPVAVLRNRPRSSRQDGRSEITRTIRSVTDSGMRTLLGMEVAREFYGAPQRYLLGADESMFEDQDGKRRSAWEAVMGRLLAVPADEEGTMPQVGQFQAQSPTPFSEQLRTYAQMISASSGVPSTHLGFVTDNPASADAIRESNSRLDKRAIRRQGQYDLGLIELGMLTVLWRDGDLPDLGAVRSMWGDPSTPTPAAAADRAVKLVAAGILPPDSDVTLEQLGYSPTDIARLKADRRRAQASQRLQDRLALVRGAQQANTDPNVAALGALTGNGSAE